MPRNIDYFNYVLDPTNFIGKTFPSKNELKVFNKEIRWNKKETKVINEAIKTYIFLMGASIIVWFVSVLFSLGITLLAPLKISGILHDEDNKFEGMPMYVVIISLVSIPIFIILLFIFRVIIMHQVNKRVKWDKKYLKEINELEMKHFNNVQWSFRNFSQYTFLNIKIPGSYRSWEDRNVVGQNKLLPIRSILPTNLLVASYKNKILPKEKIWGIFNSYNIQISMLKYLAYVAENGNPYKADDEILFDIPRWMSKADWITLKETKIQ